MFVQVLISFNIPCFSRQRRELRKKVWRQSDFLICPPTTLVRRLMAISKVKHQTLKMIKTIKLHKFLCILSMLSVQKWIKLQPMYLCFVCHNYYVTIIIMLVGVVMITSRQRSWSIPFNVLWNLPSTFITCCLERSWKPPSNILAPLPATFLETSQQRSRESTNPRSCNVPIQRPCHFHVTFM